MIMYILKFLAHSGVCSRRKAIQLINDGLVEVNNNPMTDVTYFVKPDDRVKVGGKIVEPLDLKYILLNKPRDYITTVSDERNRRTVMDLIPQKNLGRVYPIGRLDRMTTGLLILTNDGELAQKISHPKNEVVKNYQAVLDRPFAEKDMIKLRNGFRLIDGFIKVDRAFYAKGFPKNYVGVELHSGKNRIVRRIFEHLGYKIKKLDRFGYAGLTKRTLRIGQWRFLTPEEIENLKK
jgi:23S rRNA pseudouridine2605 synthase